MSKIQNMPIKLLINFGPLKMGGGQNVALNFIYALSEMENPDFEFYFVVCKVSEIKKLLESSKWKHNVVIVSDNPLVRIFQEITKVQWYLRKNGIRSVFTYFGFAILGGEVNQVIGSADSNLYFPEIDFWQSKTWIGKVKKYLIDEYRKMGVRLASGIIFENRAMYERSSILFGVTQKVLILPSILVPDENLPCDLKGKKERVRLLFLCGWQKNKNIFLIPEIIISCRNNGIDVEVVLTAIPDNSVCSLDFIEKVTRYNVTDSIVYLGPVKKEQLKDLYNKIDIVVLLSLLESFSNNIIESWYFQRPLIVADEEWSRAICDDAAVYVNRDNPKLFAERVLELLDNNELVTKLLKNGTFKLNEHPTISDRVRQELAFVKRVVS